MPISSVLEWLTRTEVATALNRSSYLMGVLSSVHLLGLTLIVGSTFVSCMRCFGSLLPEQPLSAVTRPAGKVVALGFAISLATGLLMFTPRATTVASDTAFRIKMILLLAAVVFNFVLYRYTARSDSIRPPMLHHMGLLGLALWLGVAIAGCVFLVVE